MRHATIGSGRRRYPDDEQPWSPPCPTTSPPPTVPGVGIPRPGAFDPAAFEQAATDLLCCGIAADTPPWAAPPSGCGSCGQKRLLGGYELDPATALGEGFLRTPEPTSSWCAASPSMASAPTIWCPSAASPTSPTCPGGRLHGFGRIARLVDAIGHRFTYQEWMTRDIADALVTYGQPPGPPASSRRNSSACCSAKIVRGDERVVTQAFSGAFTASEQLATNSLRAIG